jgi:hypothetical protein
VEQLDNRSQRRNIDHIPAEDVNTEITGEEGNTRAIVSSIQAGVQVTEDMDII